MVDQKQCSTETELCSRVALYFCLFFINFCFGFLLICSPNTTRRIWNSFYLVESSNNLFVGLVLLCLYFLLCIVVSVMVSFCGNMILKIAPLQRPSAVANSAGSSPLLMHDSFIAHYHPTLISSYPGSPAWISDGDGCVGAGWWLV